MILHPSFTARLLPLETGQVCRL